MFNAGDRKDVRRAEKEAESRESLRLDFLRRSMSTVEGRAWFLEILSMCHLFSDPFTGDALLEAYSKGERNIGLRIYSDVVRECPDQFILMMQEDVQRDRRDSREQPRGEGPDRDAGEPADDETGTD